MKKLSIVVPCYNEEECVKLYYDKTSTIVDDMPLSVEFVFVDDGSQDNTLETIRSLARKDKRVKYISFSRNFGKEAAFYAGLKKAQGDFVVVMDADLQDPPELLIDMYSGIVKEGFDCVGCRRTDRKGEPKLRSLFAKFFYKVINKCSDANIVDGARDYRMMTRKMVDSILSMEEVERFSKGIFGWVGFKIKWLEYKNIDRAGGKTKWNFKKLTKYAVGGIEDFSNTPLKINLVLSVLFFLTSIALFVADIVIWCMGNRVGLLLGLTTIITFIVSLIFFGMFVQGEYIGKIFKQVKGRPIYIEKENEEDL